MFAPDTYKSPQGNALTYDYDAKGNLASVTDALAQSGTTTIKRNGDGSVSSVTDPRGNRNDAADAYTTRYGYNTAGELTSVDHPAPLGDVTIGYDTLSRVTSVTDGKNQTTSYAYDVLDRLTSVTFHGGTTVTYAYDANGNRTSMTDPTGTTTTTYDKLNRVEQESLPASRTNSYTYDPAGNLKTLTDAGGTVAYGYNAVNLLATLTDPQGLVTTFGYDNHNNRTCTSYPNGVEQRSDFNAGDQLEIITGGNLTSGRAPCADATSTDSSVSYTAGDIATGFDTTLTRFVYDYTKPGATPTPATLRYSVTDKDGNVTTYGYDALDRLTAAVTKNGSGTTTADYGYGYDAASNRTSETVDGHTTTSVFNAASQLTSSKQAGAEVLLVVGNPPSLAPGQAALRTRLTTTLGHDVTLRDDAAADGTDGYDLVVIAENVSSSTLGTKYRDAAVPVVNMEKSLFNDHNYAAAEASEKLVSTLYVEDAAHPVADGPHGTVSGQVSHTNTSRWTGYAYNTDLPVAAQRIASRETQGSGRSVVFAYDGGDTMANGAVAAHKRVAVGFADDAVADLTAAGWTLVDNAVAHALTVDYSYDANGNQTASTAGHAFAYNSADQTTSITKPGGTPLTADYAGDTQLDRRSTNIATFTPTILGVSTRAGEFGSGDVLHFTRDNTGGLVGRRTTSGAYDYYLFDALGSVVALTDTTGAAHRRYTYDPYGTTTVSGSASQLIGDSNPFHFTGEYQDRQTGLYKIGHRYLQPDLGRWTQRDPSDVDAHAYLYVAGDPINKVDPTGEYWIWVTFSWGLRILRWVASSSTSDMRGSSPANYHQICYMEAATGATCYRS